MARTVRNPKIDTRTARSRLAERREPYWTVLSTGCAVGYRRGAKGGTWIGRFRDDENHQHYSPLGAADDARDADGITVFSFTQAQDDVPGQAWISVARKLKISILGMSSIVQERAKAGLLPLFHGGNMGSNPLGDANNIKNLACSSEPCVQQMSNICGWTCVGEDGPA
jgi:hypothetical protein